MSVRKSNITWCLLKRRQGRLLCEEYWTILRYGVDKTTQARSVRRCKFAENPLGTFFLAFSPDGERVASSHKDHSVRISEVKSGRCLHVLKGHPRSPWCVVFHPSNPQLLATSCLRGTVNVWELTQNDDNKLINSFCCNTVSSLAFHPTDTVLLIASGHQLLFWSWYQPEPFVTVNSASIEEKLRLVKFDALGHHILTGISYNVGQLICSHTNVRNVGMNATTAEHSLRLNTSTPLFCLQWWDFANLEIPDLQKRNFNVVAHNCRLYNNNSADISADGRLLSVLILNIEGRTESCYVRVVSLEKHNLGQCLYSTKIGQNAISTSFSPLAGYLLVGVACMNRMALFLENPVHQTTLAQIFKLPSCAKSNFSKNKIESLEKVGTINLRNPNEGHSSIGVKANDALWHPVIGYGLIACGTNKGDVYFYHV